jgi:hypothetical protein
MGSLLIQALRKRGSNIAVRLFVARHKQPHQEATEFHRIDFAGNEELKKVRKTVRAL